MTRRRSASPASFYLPILTVSVSFYFRPCHCLSASSLFGTVGLDCFVFLRLVRSLKDAETEAAKMNWGSDDHGVRPPAATAARRAGEPGP